MTKTERARALRARGYSYAVIGAVLGVTRQRAHQLVTGYDTNARRRAEDDRAEQRAAVADGRSIYDPDGVEP